MSSLQVFKFGIVDTNWHEYTYYHEYVDDVPRWHMQAYKPEIYEWLNECYPDMSYGTLRVALDPYSILTMYFDSMDDVVLFKLTWGGGALVNPQHFSPNIISKYF